MYQRPVGLGCEKCTDGEVLVTLNSAEDGIVFSCSRVCGYFKEVFF